MSGSNGSWRTFVELVGSLGVIASLLFVGLEVRQNTAAVRGATYQSILDASQEQTLWFADNTEIRELTARVNDGAVQADFTLAENFMLSANHAMTIRRIENIYVQVREGLVPEGVVQRFRPSANYFDTAWFEEFWVDFGPQMEPGFRAYLEAEFLNGDG